MEYRRLGKSGLKVSALSFGSWVTFHNQLDQSSVNQCIASAYEAGINFFDNAEAYAQGESEILMGKSLRQLGFGRDSFCVSSKVFWGGQLPTQRGLSAKHIYDACHAALKRLSVDYLDLYFCHRPDIETPIEETVRAMHHLIQQGKVLYWGTSEWSAQQISEAYGIARAQNLTPPTMEQPQYNMFHRDRVESEYLPLYETVGLGTTIWSPLASGILTGKYENGIPKDSRATLPGFEWLRAQFESSQGQEKIRKTKLLGSIARDLGTSTGQLALAWCLTNPHVSTVILGCSRSSQLEENLKALELLPKLNREVLLKIESVLDNRPEPPPHF